MLVNKSCADDCRDGMMRCRMKPNASNLLHLRLYLSLISVERCNIVLVGCKDLK